MKRLLTLMLPALMYAASINAQGILAGDMNEDCRVSIADIAHLVEVVEGKQPVRQIGMADVHAIEGTWTNTLGSVTFNPDGTTDHDAGMGLPLTYVYQPMQGTVVFFSEGTVVQYALVVWLGNGTLVLSFPPAMGLETYYKGSPVSQITLSETQHAAKPDDTFQLTALLPDDAAIRDVEWESSDPSVATVSPQGLVTCLHGGTATITCTALDGSGVSATCDISVSYRVEHISVSGPDGVIFTGDTYRFHPSIQPTQARDNRLAWQSNDESVAIVNSDGVLVGMAPGSATITCTALDGSNVSASCVVTIADRTTSITLNAPSEELNVGQNFTLTPIIQPATASSSLLWQSSNERVATVSQSGVVSARSRGTATITCTALDGTDVSASCDVTVSSALGEDVYENWTSTNTFENGSHSEYTYTIPHKAGSILSFDWSVSSEPNYDWFIVTLDGTQIIHESGENNGHYAQEFSTDGTATLVVRYSKDGSTHEGQDRASVYNVKLTDK